MAVVVEVAVVVAAVVAVVGVVVAVVFVAAAATVAYAIYTKQHGHQQYEVLRVPGQMDNTADV